MAEFIQTVSGRYINADLVQELTLRKNKHGVWTTHLKTADGEHEAMEDAEHIVEQGAPVVLAMPGYFYLIASDPDENGVHSVSREAVVAWRATSTCVEPLLVSGESTQDLSNPMAVLFPDGSVIVARSDMQFSTEADWLANISKEAAKKEAAE